MTPREAQLDESSVDDDDSVVARRVTIGSANGLTTTAARPLGIVFDLDGTLVAEPLEEQDECILSEDRVFLRPGVQQFLAWCANRGHALAIWTAAHASWAHYVSWKLRCANDKTCFDFVWDGTKLKKRRRIPRDAHGVETQSPATSTKAPTCCCWCGPYRSSCDRCECRLNRVFQCPCRFTKDLKKVWKKKHTVGSRFTRERTLMIENTPQQCLQNYGNAVYVPTYRGDPEDRILYRLQHLIMQLERSDDVRAVSKCDCDSARHADGSHACLTQNWWEMNDKNNGSTPAMTCLPISCATVTIPRALI